MAQDIFKETDQATVAPAEEVVRQKSQAELQYELQKIYQRLKNLAPNTSAVERLREAILDNAGELGGNEGMFDLIAADMADDVNAINDDDDRPRFNNDGVSQLWTQLVMRTPTLGLSFSSN